MPVRPGTGSDPALALTPHFSPAAVAVALAVVLAIASCSTFPRARYESDPVLQAALAEAPRYPDLDFVVFSDPHYFDPDLWGDGPAIEAYLRGDRKLLRESAEILDEALRLVEGTRAQLVIVPGDLTKDGERSSHLKIAQGLRRLEAAGKRVFVTCGNHDILNPEAYRYEGAEQVRVDTVSPEEFAEIYADFGYREALRRDPASLSYVAEPVAGLWLLALDACLYRENPAEGHPETGGRLSEATLEWLDAVLADAAVQRKAVLAFLHHGITEHYHGQQKHYGEYIIEEGPEVSRLLAAYNVRVVFTGHYHAQDVTVQRWDDGKFVYDVQTGSLVTYPCPIRVVSIRDNRMSLESLFVERIGSRAQGFAEFAREFTEQGIRVIAVDTMLELRVREKDALHIAPQIARAFVAHYRGDEEPPEVILDKRGVGFMGRLVIWNRRSLIQGLWADLEPPDDDILVDLGDGSWRRR